MQFPSYVVYKPVSLEYLEWARDQLRGDRMLVEFRHRSWLEDENRAHVFSFLEELGVTYVIVDAPKTEAKNLVPTVVGLTSPVAYVRLHGRNAQTWNVRGGSASERFDYLYSVEELAEWVDPLRELSGAAEEVYVLFNNNRWSRAPRGFGDGVVAQAPTNALMLTDVLKNADIEVI